MTGGLNAALGASLSRGLGVRPRSSAAPAGIEIFRGGAGQPFVVPDGVTSIDVYLCGGSGAGGSYSGSNAGPGGIPAYVVATLAVTPGETLTLDIADEAATGVAGKKSIISRGAIELLGAGGAGAGAPSLNGADSTGTGAAATDGSGTSAGVSYVPAGATHYTGTNIYTAPFFPQEQGGGGTLNGAIAPIGIPGGGGTAATPTGGKGGHGWALIGWGLTD